MTQLTSIGPTDLRNTALDLLDTDTGPWVSVYVPVERPWNEANTNRARLRSLLDGVRDEASWAGLSAGNVDEMLAPASSLLEKGPFWEGDLEGVALFLAPDDPMVLRLPFAPTVFAQVDDRVHVRPLWRHLEPDGRFYVLALSAGGVGLFRASRYSIEEVPLQGPTTLDEFLEFDEHVRSLQYHTETSPGSGKGGQRSAMFFGHEDAGDKRYVKEGILRFFRAVDNQVRDVLDPDSTQVPLLLAGIEQLRGLYRQVNRYPHLLDEAIETSVIAPNKTEWDIDGLHRRAWELIRPRFDEDRQEAIDQFRASPDRTAGNPGSVLLAAAEGRVDTLFVAEDRMVWGVFDEDRHTVRVQPNRQIESTEFLNAASIQTLQTGGTVYVSDAADVPEEGPISALLRY